METNEPSLLTARPWWPRLVMLVAALSMATTGLLDALDVTVPDSVWAWVKYAITGGSLLASFIVEWRMGKAYAAGIPLLHEELQRSVDAIAEITAPKPEDSLEGRVTAPRELVPKDGA